MKNFIKIKLSAFILLFSIGSLAQNLRSEVVQGAQQLFKFNLKVEQAFLIFDYDENHLYLLKFDQDRNIHVLKDYIVSGGHGGLSNVLKSGSTPPGVHEIYRKQDGTGLGNSGHVFAVGETFDAGQKCKYNEMILKPTLGLETWTCDFVMTRILRLRGLEGSKNDNSSKRSILIHGTPAEGQLGYHVSMGCIRMSNSDVVEIFDSIPEKTLINIVSSSAQGVRKFIPKELKVEFNQDLYIKQNSRPIRGPTSSREPASEVNMLGGGDILFHGSLMNQAMNDGFGFESFFEDVLPLLKQSDLNYANLEGPVAYQVNPYGQIDTSKGTGFVPSENIYSSLDETLLSFNYHPKAIDALINVGISIVSTANNHTFDRKFSGVDKTAEKLQEMGLSFFGTKSSQNLSASWAAIKNINGLRIGFVGCTYGIQGAGPKDSELAFKQIMFCFQGAEPNPNLLKEISRLKTEVDLVVFTPHWGTEYGTMPNPAQKKLAAAAIASGARVILGSHPHVLQPFEVIREGSEIKAVIAYSLGNFVTNQMSTDWNNQEKQKAQFPTRVSSLVGLKFRKDGGKVTISQPLWIPLYMSPKNLIGGKRRKVLLSYPEIHSGDLLKKQINAGNLLMRDRLGPEAQILTFPQTQNIFENIKW